MPMGLSKNYKEAAEAIKDHLKGEIEVNERKEGEVNIIEVVGDYSIFVIQDMDSWGGRLKFEFRDMEPQDEDSKKFRGEMAMNNPHMSAFFTSRAALYVYKAVKREVREDGKVVEESERWKDVTSEFIKKNQSNELWRNQ